MPDDETFMQVALDACSRGVAAGQSPFGACLVRDGEILAEAHNQVWSTTDPTAHAEVVCLRVACKKAGAVHLPEATIYTTTEPCPMCFAAIHWARVGRIVSGARIADAQSFGFNELPVAAATLAHLGGVAMELRPDVRREDALALFRRWREAAGTPY